MWRCLSFGRNQDAGDCCFQGKDLGTIATRCQHRKGAHSADSGGVWHRKISDGLQTNWRNQRYAVNSLWTHTSHLLNELVNNILCSTFNLTFKHIDTRLQTTSLLEVTAVASSSWNTIHPKTCLRRSTRKHSGRAAAGALSLGSSWLSTQKAELL